MPELVNLPPTGELFDIVVLGAGPAGLCVTAHLLNSNPSLKLLLVDRQHPGTEPVACAEAVSSQHFKSLAPRYNPQWIRGTINGVLFVSPDTTQVDLRLESCGLFLNRAQMHSDWLQYCLEKGAQVHLSSTVRFVGKAQPLSQITDPIQSQPSALGTRLSTTLRSIQIQSKSQQSKIWASLVIDATGAGSRLGDEEGMVNAFFDREPALFAVVQGVSAPADRIQLWFGQEFAPGGYAWVFPQGQGALNIGLVVGAQASQSFSIKKGLDNLLNKYFPQAQVLYTKGGAISCGGSTKSLTAEGFFKIGDAASMVHPLSRAGIVESMKAAHQLATLLTKGLKENLKPDEVQKRFVQGWYQTNGRGQQNAQLAKKGFGSIPDPVFNKAAKRLAKLPPNKITPKRLFWETLIGYPILLWRLRFMFLR